jgi:predicted TIM-barrel fold metal-dependent hydrolase
MAEIAMRFLTRDQLSKLLPAEEVGFLSPLPTQIVSSDEYLPAPQTPQQRQVEACLKEIGTSYAQKQHLSRRRFFQTTSGMAAAFLAMNRVYGPLFSVSEAEAATPEIADERAQALKGQMILDAHTHFVRPGSRATGLLQQRNAVGNLLHWNKDLAGRQPTIEDIQYANYMKEIYLDSDTKVALLSNAPADDSEDWLLTQDQVFEARDRVNKEAGSKRMLAHFTITPGQPGWLDAVDRAIEVYKPEGWKGYTIGDFLHMETSQHPWRLDDEKLVYPFYEKVAKAGIKNVCIHKGLFAPAVEQKYSRLRPYVDVSDVGRPAKDFPQLNFVIYHAGFRYVGGFPVGGMDEFNQTGRLSWTTDLAEIPEKLGVKNVYADVGATFAWTCVGQPQLAAAIMATLIKGLGADHVIWGTDSIWTGSPQWQIEALRRLEIPEEMQKQHDFAALGAADGAVKNAILGQNAVRIFGYDQHAGLAFPDRFAALKSEYERMGQGRSNLRHGYIAKPAVLRG